MVLNWLMPRPAAGGLAPRPWTRLELERLEDRTVPSAIRVLAGFTTSSLPHEDDAPSQMANLGFNINFFGVNTNHVFVNNNGNITLNNALSAYVPTGLTTALGEPIIAPFFADVDTTNPASGVVTYGTDTLCGEQAFGVDWFNVGYFSSHVNKLNTFQLILVNRPDVGAGDFDIEFNYQQIQWESGDASGGTNGLGGPTTAVVGYSNGTGTPGTFSQLPGSLMAGSFIDGGPEALASHDLMATTPGRYHFLVRNGQVVTTAPTTTANDNVSSMTRFFDPFRFITDDLATGLQHGNVTLINNGGTTTTTSPVNATDACLDIPDTTTTTTTSATFASPITIVFDNLPSNVTIANRSGVTASGLQYISVNVNGGVPQGDVLRIAVEITNSNQPAPNAPSTFFGDELQFQTFAGTFDPTTL